MGQNYKKKYAETETNKARFLSLATLISFAADMSAKKIKLLFNSFSI